MIEPHIPLYLTLAFLLVAGNAFFVAAEFAIVKVRTTRIQEMVSSRLPGSRLAHEVVSNLDQYLSACQLGITMVSLGLGWVGEEAFTGLLLPLLADRGPYAVVTARTLAAALAFAIITALHLPQTAVPLPGEIRKRSARIERHEHHDVRLPLSVRGRVERLYGQDLRKPPPLDPLQAPRAPPAQRAPEEIGEQFLRSPPRAVLAPAQGRTLRPQQDIRLNTLAPVDHPEWRAPVPRRDDPIPEVAGAIDAQAL